MRSKFKWIFALLLAFSMQFSFAQEKTITGIVTEKGMPLPGVSVVVKGTTVGTQTDFDGKYSIKASSGQVIEFTYVGFKTQSATVGASNSVNVVMEEDSQQLGEVVVVAYGVQTKESLTGSVGEVKAEAITKITSGNVTQGLVGKVAGVQVFNNNGLPGEPAVIRFRGIGSLSASAAPLYVVDGVPFNGDVASINNNDIESMSFLKDASAAALYGNRGANGVIIITTKKGKNKKTVITVDSKSGFASRAVPEYDIMTGQKEYYEGYHQALKNGFMFGPSNLSAAAASNAASAGLINGELGLNYNAYRDVPNGSLVDPLTGRLNPNATSLKYNEDWSDYLFGDGFFTQSHMSVSGGTENSTHFFSVGYEKNDGYVVNSGLEKITTRLKFDSQVTDKFKVGANLAYSHNTQNAPDGWDGGGTYSSPFGWVRNIAPIYPVRLYDAAGNPVLGPTGTHLFDDGTGVGGSPVRPYGSLQHPYATAVNDVKKYQTDNLFATGFLEYKIADGLKFTYTLTGDLFSSTYKSLDTPLYGDAVNVGGRVNYQASRTMSYTQQQLLNYNKSFGNHNFDVLLGHETLDRQRDFISANRSRLLLPNSPVLNHAGVNQGHSGGGSLYSTEGFFSRLAYDYDNKYYINASVRRDGSSRFHQDNRWGTFYGLGASWRVSQESFLKDVSWLDELKLKASYGEQGNDNITDAIGAEVGATVDFPYADQYSVFLTNTDDGLNFTRVYVGNKDITWETNANFNAGFDISLFDRRLNVEAEYFQRNVTDMLFLRPLGPSSGGSFKPENIGDMTNKGIELTINADVIRGQDFQFAVNFNATHYKNEITRLPELPGREGNNIVVNNQRRFIEGGGAYDYFMQEFAGVNPATGAALFWMDDAANPGQRILTENYTDADRYDTGKSALSDVYGGFGFDMKYKGFDLGVGFAYQMGGYSYDGIYMGLISLDERGQNLHRDFSQTWTSDNTGGTLPRVDVGNPNQYYNTSTLGLIKSDYLSIQNISLGYTFKQAFVEQMGLGSLRFYGLVDNVALWSKRKGFDPRVGGVTGGSDNKYSLLRTVSFGVNIQF
ncbi:TonB-linked SusC/RagA family outer membrane protein [Flavobacterium arsenatis]|uniref:TonB-linked SusC/RagA family outer membrane protein n=1 Tax=Flavobacterium arsenatis TaxID=1484332 RepID=A0ABU1TM60_9FLAO|nr:TonB-dependent receptor [Flavobacterium arsenatis]MDR6966956.1 TonB-linked SusC/RagA family outer membrane protein [Flavobacterium arsenatis]